MDELDKLKESVLKQSAKLKVGAYGGQEISEAFTNLGKIAAFAQVITMIDLLKKERQG